MHKFIKKSLLLIIILFSVQIFAQAKTIEFAQVSDIHYTLNDSYKEKYLHFLSLSIEKKQPKFVMFLGDNIDKSREGNIIGLMRSIRPINQPYYLIFGDKDAHELGGIEKNTYLDIVSTFNKYQDENKKYYYFKPNRNIVCVVLDTTSEFAQSKHGEIDEKQLSWLENLLIKYPKKMFIIFQHTPIVAPRDEYKLSMVNTEKYSEILKKYKNILMVSSGHYHQSAIMTDENGIRHISAPAFNDIPHSYQLIKINYKKNSYLSPKDVEITVSNIKV